ncbi:peptidase family C78-domain-containing protein [Circinella umbellata]|nr:peptidase family C78-domain-containing protein [Circinella umbellata]
MQLYHMETRHPDHRPTTTPPIENKPLQGISPLKVGQQQPLHSSEESYESDLYQQKDVKRQKEYDNDDVIITRNLARTYINADEELWQILSALEEKSRTPGVIPRLEPQFTNSNRKNKSTVSAYLCSPYTDHIATGFMDLGWGCGYRNCQMLMTFLQRKQEAGDSILRQVTDISGLQLLLERAWKDGFDVQGAKQLNNRVYKTRKWIGTTEVYSMLVYLGIRCTILDFHRPSGPHNTHETLFDWIQSYFQNAVSKQDENEEDDHPTDMKDKTVYITQRPPLYLQHSGHSRTVIGIELLQNGKRNLIMFDPGRRMLRSYRSRTEPEDDMDESTLSSSCSQNGDSEEEEEEEEGEEDNNKSQSRKISEQQEKKSTSSKTSFASRILSNWKPRTHLPSNLLRPFRVDAKAIAKNRQYQLLVLGEVKDERPQGGYLSWNDEKGYLLDEKEREAMKIVTSTDAL